VHSSSYGNADSITSYTRNITVSNDNAYANCKTKLTDSSGGGNFTGPVLSKNSGSVGTTAVTTLETLMSYTIPVNRLAAGKTLKLLAYGRTAATANNKTILLYFGATQIGVCHRFEQPVLVDRGGY
jgi:hypothetical protein